MNRKAFTGQAGNATKKRRGVIVFFAMVILFAAVSALILNAMGFGVFGAFAEKPDIKEIHSEQLIEIKQAYLDMQIENAHYPKHMTADNVSVMEYCGTHNGCVVMMFTDSIAVYAQAIRVVNVAGINIQYSDSNVMYAYKDGAMYTLEQAYVKGLLKKTDIGNIRDIHNKY